MTRQISRIGDEMRGVVEAVIKRLVPDLTDALFEDTPKLTSFAANNWVPTIGTPFQGTAGTREQAEEGQLFTTPRLAGKALVESSYKLRNGAAGIVYITDNVDYIVDLNDGSSHKAPAAFVQSTIDRAITGLR